MLDVVKHHALLDSLVAPLKYLGFKDSFVPHKFTFEIEIATLVISPGLFPSLKLGLVNGDTRAFETLVLAAVEFESLSNHCSVENFVNDVDAVLLHTISLVVGCFPFS